MELMPKVDAKLVATLNQKLKDPYSVIVFMYLLSERSTGSTQVSASLQSIADGTGLSKSTIQRSVAYLKKRGAVKVKKESPNSEPVYTLKPMSDF